jgi:hypothetical protein
MPPSGPTFRFPSHALLDRVPLDLLEASFVGVRQKGGDRAILFKMKSLSVTALATRQQLSVMVRRSRH